MNINVLLEDAFDGHQGQDLFDMEQTAFRVFKVKKSSTVEEILMKLADTFVRYCSHKSV